MPPPRVTSVQPTEAGPGETIAIRGEGFGTSSTDLKNLTLGGVPCQGAPADWFKSESELECLIPSDHSLWRYVLRNPGAVQPYVGIEVVMRTGVSNLERYENNGEKISIDPSDVLSDKSVDGLLPPGNFGMDAPMLARLIPKGIAQSFPPPVPPLAPTAWREVGDDLRVIARWFYPSEDLERLAVD